MRRTPRCCLMTTKKWCGISLVFLSISLLQDLPGADSIHGAGGDSMRGDSVRGDVGKAKGRKDDEEEATGQISIAARHIK